jgi:ABC-type antimicrobial peptide transport system permease subunit
MKKKWLPTPKKYCISRMEHSQTAKDSKISPFRQTSFSFRLSWQELKGRKIVFYINVILVALLIAIPVSLDLIGKARKSSVETRIDYIGPSLILVPRGILSSDLVTAQMKGKTYSTSLLAKINQRLGSYVRNAEPRLTTRMLINGRKLPVTGINFQKVYSYPFREYATAKREVVLGKVAAEKLILKRGESLLIEGYSFTVAGIIHTTGGIEDASVFLSLQELQELSGQQNRINEIRLFPESASAYEELKLKLDEYSGTVNIIDAYRGDTAEKDVDSTLLVYQRALYTAAFILIALCIMISTYINLDGRKAEISTIYTLGAAQGVIFQILILRTLWITLLGSIAGYGVALSLTLNQAGQVPLRFIWSTQSFLEVVLATMCLGMVVTIPFAFYSVFKRDLIAHL